MHFNPLLAFLLAFFLHLALSYGTLPPGQFLPDPYLRIYVKRIHKVKHGSDTGSDDNEGRFRPQQFADFFAKHGKEMNDGSGEMGLTLGEALMGVWGQRSYLDLFGPIASAGECKLRSLKWAARFQTSRLTRDFRDCGVPDDLARGRNHVYGGRSGHS